MSAADDNQWLTRIKTLKSFDKGRDQCTVFGFIRREQERLFPVSDNVEIPPLVSWLCLWYLHLPKTILVTPNHYNYKRWFEIGPKRKSVEFEVKASNDAHIALGSDKLHNGKHWEIVISGWANTMSVIRKRNQGHHHSTYRGRALDAGACRSFWIEWDEDGALVVGSGDINDEEKRTIILECPFDKNLPIDFVSFCTGWGSSGYWIIYELAEIVQ